MTFLEMSDSNPESRAQIGQEQLAEYIAGLIRKEPGIHIAIDGPWGSGKTTILEDVQKELASVEPAIESGQCTDEIATDGASPPTMPKNGDSDESIIVTTYRPWRYSPDATTLRRTLLMTIYTAVQDAKVTDLPPIEKRAFYSETEEPSKPSWKESLHRAGEGLVTSLATIGLRTVAAFIILAIIASLTYSLVLAGIADLQVFWRVVLASTAILVAAVLTEPLRSLAVGLRQPETNPKIEQIEQFEEKYRAIMDRLGEEKRQLVVLVDDLDRCQNDEIRAVISGLSTYLGSSIPGGIRPVSFVVAIDSRRIIQAVEEKTPDTNGREPNIVFKTFQRVIPVPVPSTDEIEEVVVASLAELGWNIANEGLVSRKIANLSVRYAESNLRTIRVALSEAFMLQEIAAELGIDEDLEVAQTAQDPVLLFRIALIRTLVPDKVLRKFLVDPRFWLQKAGTADTLGSDIFRSLMNEPPRFERGRLDPRKLLALGTTGDLTHFYNIDTMFAMASEGKRDEIQEEIKFLEGTARVNLAWELHYRGYPNLDGPTQAKVIQAIIQILAAARNHVDADEVELLEDLVKMLKEDNLLGNLPEGADTQWIAVAASAGEAALNLLFDQASPFTGRGPLIINKLVEVALADSGIPPRYVLQRADEYIAKRGNAESVAAAVEPLYEKLNQQDLKPAASFMLTCVTRWDFGKAPDGLPDGMLRKDVVKEISAKEAERAVSLLQRLNEGDENRARFAEELVKVGWPEAPPH